MMDNPELDPLLPKDIKIENNHLQRIFLEHLNSIYLGKHHLLDFFKEVEAIACLQQLKLAIDECSNDTRGQIENMDAIYESINKQPSKTSILGIKAITLEAYLAVIKGGKTPVEKDVFILFYLQIIEGIEVNYFNVLKSLAQSIGYNHKALDQPIDTALENKTLFETIYKEYIS